MNNTAEIIKFKRPVVKADIDDGFDRVASTLTNTLANPPVSLSGREYQVINAVISKTYRYHKKTDWIASIQLAEITGIDKTNVSKIKTALVRKKVLLKDGKKIGINPVVSEWENEPKKQKVVKNDYVENSQIRLLKQSNTTSTQSKTTIKPAESDPHNRKTIKQKTINTEENIYSTLPKTGIFSLSQSTKISKNFPITEDMKAWALEEKITADLENETIQFVDHFTSKGDAREDWLASWRFWMRNTKKFNKPQLPKNQNQNQKLSPIGQSMAAKLAKMSPAQ